MSVSAVAQDFPITGSRLPCEFVAAASEGSHSHPTHAYNLTSHAANARDRLADRLNRYRHMKGIGVHEAVVVARDRDVSWPKYEVAAFEFK